MIDLLFVALFQAAAGPADAATTQPAPAAEAAAPAANQEQAEPEDRPRCRREIITGTRLSRRVCTTAAEDRAMAEDSRDQLQQMQVRTLPPAN